MNSRVAIVGILSLLLLSAACRSSARVDPVSRTNDLYSTLMPKLFPIEVKETGVAYRHWVARLPGETLAEISFVIERPRPAQFPERSFGPTTATYREALGKPLSEQIETLLPTVSADRIEGHLQVATYTFTEQSCPGIGEILNAVEAETYGMRWWDAVWHPVRIDGIIKTLDANYTFTCNGSPCLGLGEWSTRAQKLLYDCARKSRRTMTP